MDKSFLFPEKTITGGKKKQAEILFKYGMDILEICFRGIIF